MKSNRLVVFSLIALIASGGFSLLEFVAQKKYATNVNSDVAAIINGNEIKKVDYLTAVAMIEEDKRGDINRADYQLVIDRLMEEELLFQYALEGDILFEANITQLVISNMLSNIVSHITSDDYSEEQIKTFYDMQIENNPAFKQAMAGQGFAGIKDDLAIAMFEIEKSKAIRDYLSILNKKASISFANDNPVVANTQLLRESL